MMCYGTGWAHFLSFAGFYGYFRMFDRVLYGQGRRYDQRLLLVMPAVITLGVAGPYCAVYSVVVFLSCGVAWLMGRQQKRKDGRMWLLVFACTMIPLLLYMWSNSYEVEDHAGAVDVGLTELSIHPVMVSPTTSMEARDFKTNRTKNPGAVTKSSVSPTSTAPA